MIWKPTEKGCTCAWRASWMEKNWHFYGCGLMDAYEKNAKALRAGKEIKNG